MKDKDEMSTAVTTSTPVPDEPSNKSAANVPLPAKTGYQVYKPGDGYATRLGMMIVAMSFVAFACHHWYYNWVFLRDFPQALGLGKLTEWMTAPAISRFVQVAGTISVATAGFLTAYYFIYIKRRSAEFLVKTDGELAKVTWPKIVPWFRAETQVWGATYVVLIVIAAMTIYVFFIDTILGFIAKVLFYGGNG